jgi:hypothetical protein
VVAYVSNYVSSMKHAMRPKRRLDNKNDKQHHKRATCIAG